MCSKEKSLSYNCSFVPILSRNVMSAYVSYSLYPYQETGRVLRSDWAIRRGNFIRQLLLELNSKAERKHTETEETLSPCQPVPFCSLQWAHAYRSNYSHSMRHIIQLKYQKLGLRDMKQHSCSHTVASPSTKVPKPVCPAPMLHSSPVRQCLI